MSNRVEWLDARYTTVTALAAGDTLDGEEPDDSRYPAITGEVALVLAADEVFVIEGDRARIKHLLATALASIDGLPGLTDRQ